MAVYIMNVTIQSFYASALQVLTNSSNESILNEVIISVAMEFEILPVWDINAFDVQSNQKMHDLYATKHISEMFFPDAFWAV